MEGRMPFSRPALILLSAFSLVFSCLAATPPVNFDFTLATSQKTSAGVFKADGTLMRTLWSNVSYPAGVNAGEWDGLDDFGNLVVDGSYVIKVLSSSCSYTWEGVLGNTSTSFTGPTVWRSYNPIGGLAINGTTAYYGNGYAEAGSTSGKFSTTAPNGTKQLILSKGPDVWNVATDGTLVYWSGSDPNATANTFVFGTRVSDDAQYPFASGASYSVLYGITLTNTIDKRTDGSPVSGLAVQKTGGLLFVSHADKDELQILNKTTGAVVQTVTSIIAPGALAIDGADNLWLVRKNGALNEVAQYSVAVDGTMTPLQVLATTFDTPMALGISPDNATLVVVDGGASQQLKAFDTTTGAAAWTFGQAGGYTVSPAVSDDRFMFESHAGIAFQPDGSFWVSDYGNGRAQHYTAARAFIERIQYRPYSYSCAVDENDPTRVFSNFLEYSVNYSLPLAPDNGSWSHVRNWAKLLPAGFGSGNYRNMNVCTLSNGRTYTLLRRNSDGKFGLFEITANSFRDTGIVSTTANVSLQPDGSIRTVNNPAVGGTVTWTKQTLTGFDASGNPIYSAAATLASAPATGTDPVYWGDTTHARSGVQTTSDLVISFDQQKLNTPTTRGTGYHLGAVRVGTTDWLWRTSMATHINYSGPWPEDGAFDVGNGVNNAGSVPMTTGRHVFYGYYGEFYKASQVNKYRHYYDSGLMVGEFGVVGADVGGNTAGATSPAGYAGNGFSAWVVKVPDGRAFLYHNDESLHGGVHRWRIDGLDTVAEQTIPISWTAPIVAGLRGEYYDSADLNNAELKTVRTDSGVNFTWGASIPSGTALTAADTWSVRWSGFITPLFSQTYTFYTNTDDGVRLWVNGKLIIDQWSNTGAEQSGTIALTAGQPVSIKLEYFQDTGTAFAALSWSSTSQTKQIIPQSQLCWAPWQYPTPAAGSFDVLAGLSVETSIFNNAYGMTRDTAADTTDYWNRWILRTSKFSYRTARTPGDFSMLFVNNTPATRSLLRDLGTPSDATTQWTLNASVNFDGNYPNHGSNGGQYLEVLDDTDLIIARFYPRQVSHPNDYRIYANTLIVAQGTQTVVALPMEEWQPLTITATSSGITFNYAAYAPVTAAVFDAGADWRRAKTLRFAYFCSGVSSGYPRAVALRGATFTRSPGSAMPDFAVGAATLTGGNGNGILDRNEHNFLTVALANNGLGDASGISATLSTTTPGITILQPQSAYADLAPGLSGNSSLAFEIDSAPDIPVGTTAEFTLLITHAGGSVSRTFTLAPTTDVLGSGRIDTDADGIADWWTLQNFGHRTSLPGDLSRPLDAPAGDGVANLLKYSLGLDAQVNGLQNRVSSGMASSAGNDYLTLTYTRPEPEPDGLVYSVETSNSLAPSSWSALGTVEMSSIITGSLRTITVRSATPAAAGRDFIRLKVTRP
jgi:flagellar hook assembly protein FlgD